jgi:serine/threonine protein kinase
MVRVVSDLLNLTRNRFRRKDCQLNTFGRTQAANERPRGKRSMECLTHTHGAITAMFAGMFGSCFPRVLTVNQRRLVVMRELGEGGFSFVYLARDKKTNRLFAVKQLRAQTKEQSRSIRREIRVQQELSHPNLLPLIDHAAKSTPRFEEILLVFPAYQRGTVFDVVREQHARGQHLTVDHALTIFAGIVAGVHCMHTHDPPYAHRDLKPHNVLLDDKDCPVRQHLFCACVLCVCVCVHVCLWLISWLVGWLLFRCGFDNCQASRHQLSLLQEEMPRDDGAASESQSATNTASQPFVQYSRY